MNYVDTIAIWDCHRWLYVFPWHHHPDGAAAPLGRTCQSRCRRVPWDRGGWAWRAPRRLKRNEGTTGGLGGVMFR